MNPEIRMTGIEPTKKLPNPLPLPAMDEPSTNKQPEEKGVTLLEHSYDGIQEFDQKLPNWWLFTLYGAILFSIAYWLVVHQVLQGTRDTLLLENELAQVEARRIEETVKLLDDANLLELSRNTDFVAAGSQVFMTNQCATCHGADLRSGPGMVGVNLVDSEWKHGGNPISIFNTITQGVASAGMPRHEGILSPTAIAQVTAYILSMQEPIQP